MSDREQPSQPLAGIFAVLALAVGAVVIQQQTLVGSRPTTSTAPTQQDSRLREAVPARLWQDPFAAVKAHRATVKGKPGKGSAVPADLLTGYDRERRLHVLIAMVNGGPYTGAEEQRRRQRYAIVSALGAVGYAPDDPERIGYVVWPLGPAARDFPFEWFTNEKARGKALVLYFDEDGTGGKQPLKELERLYGEVMKNKKAPPDAGSWSVIGPGSTSVLQAMVHEVSAGAGKQLKSVRFVTSQATASDQHLAGLAQKPVEDFFKDKLNLHRVTSTDDVLAERLVHELTLRSAWKLEPDVDKLSFRDTSAVADRLDQLDRVVLVSEWDTPYGRQLPLDMRDALLKAVSVDDRKKICPVPGEPATPYSPKCPILFFSYLRGLDGQLPAAPGSNKQGDKESRDQPDGAKEAKDSAAKRATVERPVGDGQVDYLRRIGQVVSQKQSDLRSRGRSISAVGVLGTDFYDKLLVLQAVRGALPEALAFMTDLDTELIHPAEVKSKTHNLVVASPFGLSLRDELQAGHPPFRDSYETATYYATLVALEGVPEKGVRLAAPPPRVFEIGRNAIVDLSDLDQRSGGSGGAGSDRTCSAAQPSACPSVHPERMLPQIPASARMQMAVFVVLASLLLVLTFRQVLRGVTVAWTFATKSWTGTAVTVAALLILAPLAFASARDVFFNDRGEPWAVMNGVSMWPTEIMRLVTWALTCLLLHKGWRDIQQSNTRLTEDFRLEPRPSAGHAHAEHVPPEPRTRWKCLVEALRNRLTQWKSPEEYWKEASMAEIWQRHMQPAAFGDRILLLCAPVALYLGAVGVLFLMLGFPVRPARGSVVSAVDRGILILCVVSFAFLLFFVIDETRRCGSLVRRLTGRQNWPRETCIKFGQQRLARDEQGRAHSYFEDWLDVEFIGRRTEMVTRLIYYPFLIMTLMTLARSALFDNWGYPPALIIALSLGLAIAIGCAVHLRSVAEKARRAAVDSLGRKLLVAQQDKECNLDGPIRTLIEWVERYRVGAFCPFAQQAWVKALLIPIGSLSALPILDFLLLGQA